MTAIAAILFAAAFGWLAWRRLHTLLTYFQQEEYNARRFGPALLRVRLFDVRASAALAILGAARAAFDDALGWNGAALLIGAAALAAIAWREGRYRYKKPLVLTQRARRIRNLAAAVMVLPLIFALIGPFTAVIAVQLVPLALIIANAALAPMQARVNAGYIDEARAKLERMNPVRIGITGSFGKTTTKHIFAEILGISAPVFFSRGSINTVLGLTRHIRERLQWSHRYFIAEMGAYGIGSVARLCDFVKPDFGIVTAIGDAHTERFGSIENIAIAKAELIEAVCARGGTGIVAEQVMAHAPFAALKTRFPSQLFTVGSGENASFAIRRCEMQDAAWQITLADRRGGDEGREIAYALPLLGEHNVMNSALAVAAAVVIDPSIAPRVPLVTREVEQVPHRLQKRESPGEPLVLDDAYNSNETGFRNAVGVLAELAAARGGRAILVTPGIAELGMEHGRVHAALGEYCARLVDEVVVVNPARIPSFTAALEQAGRPALTVGSFAEARAMLARTATAEDVILYENDLPDLLEEKRLL